MIRHLTFIALIITALSSMAATIQVGPSARIHTIHEALKTAGNGDTILVNGGVYTEGNILIEKSVTLLGRNNPVIDGLAKNLELITIAADSVTIDGFTIQNGGFSFLRDLAGIRIQRKSFFTIRNNTLLKTMFAIYLEKASDGIIQQNTIVGEAKDEISSGNGIHAWYCKNLTITGNTVHNQRDGIYFEFVENSKVSHNISKGNLRYGLHFMFSNNDDYADNLFENNGAGVAVMFSKQIGMFRNTFKKNWGSSACGLLLKEIYDGRIEQNAFIKNTTGIKVDGSTRIHYLRNNFENNGWAIKFVGGCYDNEITSNNFVSNAFDLVIESARNNNTIDGNYWSAYTGYDLDKDGVGDVPFRPVKLFSYIVSRSPEAMVLLRSLFIDIIDYAEKIRPMFTPENVIDHAPLMQKITV